MKYTAIAPSNIAFIKYWGKKDEILRLPQNGSISMNLSNLLTKTTVEFNDKLTKDKVLFNGKEDNQVLLRVSGHLDRVRELAKKTTRAKVAIENNFPVATGLSASASVFASLSLAATKSIGLSLSEKELSILARQGSGSACRSIPDGIVEWLDGDTSSTSYSVSLYPPSYWEIYDVVVVVSKNKKEVGSTEGQKLVDTSPFFQTRLLGMKKKIEECKQALKIKDFTRLGVLSEAEALEMHAVMLTSHPSLIYWTAESLTVMKFVKRLRTDGLEAYFTINTGQDVHILVEKKNLNKLTKKLKELDVIRDIIINKPAKGAHLIV
ncbi:diphosphomevalonate decarboxylase [Candidatus Gottesmanbacteria bacterium]|nr:diphosphomevalonate decarboxylase [Candidatus Gottesmanbacteria bacterium]